MTTLTEFITKGIEKTGSVKELARVLGVSPTFLSNAKNMRCGLPLDACGKLGDLIGVDKFTVAVAAELVTEKNEKRRAYFAPFVSGLAKAASFAALAIVTTFVTTPAESLAATSVQADNDRGIYIMRNIDKRRQKINEASPSLVSGPIA